MFTRDSNYDACEIIAFMKDTRNSTCDRRFHNNCQGPLTFDCLEGAKVVFVRNSDNESKCIPQ